jgi:hypothetical protein
VGQEEEAGAKVDQVGQIKEVNQEEEQVALVEVDEFGQ